MTESPFLRHLLVLTLLALVPLTAAADIVSSVNKVRAQGCPGRRGGEVPLRESRQLDAVARQLARGDRSAPRREGGELSRRVLCLGGNLRGSRQRRHRAHRWTAILLGLDRAGVSRDRHVPPRNGCLDRPGATVFSAARARRRGDKSPGTRVDERRASARETLWRHLLSGGASPDSKSGVGAGRARALARHGGPQLHGPHGARWQLAGGPDHSHGL